MSRPSHELPTYLVVDLKHNVHERGRRRGRPHMLLLLAVCVRHVVDSQAPWQRDAGHLGERCLAHGLQIGIRVLQNGAGFKKCDW